MDRIDRLFVSVYSFTLLIKSSSKVGENMRKIVVISLFIVGLCLVIYIPYQQSFVIEAGETDKVLAYFRIKPDHDVFQIEYTHSIHRTDVKETYQILPNGTIRLIELMYEDTAIGMPSNAEDGEVFEMVNGKYFIRNMKRDFQVIDMRIAQVVGEHKLFVRNQEILFTHLVEPGSLVTLRTRRLSLWQQWGGVNIIGKST